jgi:hypothetical protein
MHFPPKSRLLRTLPIDLPSTARPLALITLKNRTLNPLAQLFSDYVREAAKPLRLRAERFHASKADSGRLFMKKPASMTHS